VQIKTINNQVELDGKMKQFVHSKLSNIFLKNNDHIECNKILFINPPDGDEKMFNYNSAKSGRYTNFAPYGLGIISKHLKSLGYETKILNLNHLLLKKVNELDEQKFDYREIISEAISKEIKDFDPDLVGLTCMFSMTHKSLKNVSELIKNIKNVPVAVGGVHISNTIWNENTRKQLIQDLNKIDLFFLFEAELSFSEFINSINSDFNSIDSYKQLVIRDDNESVFFSSRERPEGENLNIIPEHDTMQSSELSNYGKVGNFNFLINKQDRITTILSNRGCRAQCTFCSVRNFNGKKIRTRSIQSIIDELLFLRDQQNIKHVMWLDDDLLYNTNRTIELFNEMIKQDVGITWDASNGVIASSVTEEIMSAAEESGCLGVVIGMESGNPKILREIRKPGTVEIFLRAAEVLKKHPKINSRAFLMIGFPKENYGQILDTINVSKKMDMDWNYITPLQPLPNTPIFDDMVEDNFAGTEAFGDIKYFVGGGYSGISSNKKSNNPLQNNFLEIFKDKDMEEVPGPKEIKVIWAFMNYYLNFERLSKVNIKEKIEQNYKWMNYVSNIVAKNDPIAIYYKMIMHRKFKGFYDNEDYNKFKSITQNSKVWKTNINHLGLTEINT
tara:strand:+ start:877 stop:2721 length:1845 start_codon:yes stop_codon:yes gene_type:complete